MGNLIVSFPIGMTYPLKIKLKDYEKIIKVFTSVYFNAINISGINYRGTTGIVFLYRRCFGRF